MGPMPVIRTTPQGELGYVIWRNGDTCAASSNCDGREDATMGEMVLDATSVPGYAAGDFRFIAFEDIQTDEMGYVSMAGDHLFHSHWLVMEGVHLDDRSDAKGAAFTSPITTTKTPYVIWRQDTPGLHVRRGDALLQEPLLVRRHARLRRGLLRILRHRHPAAPHHAVHGGRRRHGPPRRAKTAARGPGRRHTRGRKCRRRAEAPERAQRPRGRHRTRTGVEVPGPQWHRGRNGEVRRRSPAEGALPGLPGSPRTARY
ncbi:MAG: hypothetical protein U0263_36060 [Polyangiaceae bacterium]